jgi:hypothetical protein
MNYKAERYLTPPEIEKIKELSTTHYVKEIAKIIGCDKRTVLNYQLDPRHGIENPQRKYVKRKTDDFETADGYFSIDKWARQFDF